MIATERNRIINHSVTSHTTNVKPLVRKLIYIDNSVGYDSYKKAYIMN